MNGEQQDTRTNSAGYLSTSAPTKDSYLQFSAAAPPTTTPVKQRPYKLLRRASTFVTDTHNDINLDSAKSRRKRLSQVEQNNNELPSLYTSDYNEYNQSWFTKTKNNPRQVFNEVYTNLKVRNVLKASLAYLIGSLVVYTPFGKIYGLSDNKHMVATIATYFSPARTSGSMTESTLFVLFAVAYSFFLSFMSMVTSAFFYGIDMIEIGYVIDILVFCGVGIGSISFMKQHVNTPTFTQACTVAFISLIVILTKEGNVQAGILSIDKLFQNFALIFSGIVISTVLCYTIWPQSAVEELKRTLNKSLGCYSQMLGQITDSFLSGGNLKTPEYEKLNEQMVSHFTKLESSLSDAKYELLLTGREREYNLIKKMVASCHRLASHMGGLTSSVQVQWHLLQDDAASSSNDYSSASSGNSVVSIEELTSRVNSFEQLANMTSPNNEDAVASGENNNTTSELFQVFVNHLGPPLRLFSQTLRNLMNQMAFDTNLENNFDIKMVSNLRAASCSYSSARAKALKSLYQHDIFQSEFDVETMADEEGIAASCGNFSYVLEAFGMEMEIFVSVLEEYHEVVNNKQKKTFDWIQFWSKESSSSAHEREPLLGNEQQQEQQEEVLNLHKSYFHKQPKIDRGFGYKLWKGMRIFRRTDVKFGIKVGIGAALFAVPAFMDKIRPVFGRWRGEWGLITYSIIMAKSIGGTLKTVRIRIGGTLIGAGFAYLTWQAFPNNPYMLAFVGWLLALPSFWIILYWKTNNPFGRFILLTYNITALYTYSLSRNDNEDDDDEGGKHPLVADIAFHRFVSVTVGTLWALLITVLFWPNSARRQFKDTLSVQLMRMGLVWKSDPLEAEKHAVRGVKGEHQLKATMAELKLLLSQATEELRMKGPYPEKEHKSILKSTQNIIDIFQNMSVLVAKFRNPSDKEIEMIDQTRADRKEISSRIFLFFYLVSSAVRMGIPLPDKLPSTEHAIDRMLAKLNEFRQQSINEPADEEDFVLFYSYILATIMIAEELSRIAINIQQLYGVIEDETLEVI